MMEDFYMPTDIQFKDDLRKEEIKLEELLSLLKNQEYEKLQKKLERDLKRVPNFPTRAGEFILSKLGLLYCYPPVKFRKMFL